MFDRDDKSLPILLHLFCHCRRGQPSVPLVVSVRPEVLRYCPSWSKWMKAMCISPRRAVFYSLRTRARCSSTARATWDRWYGQAKVIPSWLGFAITGLHCFLRWRRLHRRVWLWHYVHQRLV